jgi:hypothetical protein
MVPERCSFSISLIVWILFGGAALVDVDLLLWSKGLLALQLTLSMVQGSKSNDGTKNASQDSLKHLSRTRTAWST